MPGRGAHQERIKEETATLTRRRDGLLSYVGRINAFDSKAAGAAGPLEPYEIKEVIARGQYSYFQVRVRVCGNSSQNV